MLFFMVYVFSAIIGKNEEDIETIDTENPSRSFFPRSIAQMYTSVIKKVDGRIVEHTEKGAKSDGKTVSKISRILDPETRKYFVNKTNDLPMLISDGVNMENSNQVILQGDLKNDFIRSEFPGDIWMHNYDFLGDTFDGFYSIDDMIKNSKRIANNKN